MFVRMEKVWIVTNSNEAHNCNHNPRNVGRFLERDGDFSTENLA